MEIKETGLLLFANGCFLQETTARHVPSYQGQLLVPHRHKLWALYSPVCSRSVKMPRTPAAQAVACPDGGSGAPSSRHSRLNVGGSTFQPPTTDLTQVHLHQGMYKGPKTVPR